MDCCRGSSGSGGTGAAGAAAVVAARRYCCCLLFSIVFHWCYYFATTIFLLPCLVVPCTHKHFIDNRQRGSNAHFNVRFYIQFKYMENIRFNR